MRLAKWPPWAPNDNTSVSWSHNSYRPLVVMSFRADHYFHGDDVLGYHITNVVVHVLACVAGLFLLGAVLGPRRWLHSLLAASLFAVHPIHTEVVANITSRAETMCGVVVLGAMALYLRLVPAAAPGQGGGPPRSSWVSVLACLVTSALIIVGALCKETALVVPVVVLCLDILCRSAAAVVETPVGTSSLRSAAAYLKACILGCSRGRVLFWVLFQVVLLYARVALLSSG